MEKCERSWNRCHLRWTSRSLTFNKWESLKIITFRRRHFKKRILNRKWIEEYLRLIQIIQFPLKFPFAKPLRSHLRTVSNHIAAKLDPSWAVLLVETSISHTNQMKTIMKLEFQKWNLFDTKKVLRQKLFFRRWYISCKLTYKSQRKNRWH